MPAKTVFAAIAPKKDAGRDVTVIDRPPVLDRDTQKDPKAKLPKRYQVLALNDDTTLPETVVEKISKHFNMNAEAARRAMWTAHTTGKCIVGAYPKDVAETKTDTANLDCSRTRHPLAGRGNFPEFIELRFACQPE